MRQNLLFTWRTLTLSLIGATLLFSCSKSDEVDAPIAIDMISTSVSIAADNQSLGIIKGDCSGNWTATKDDQWFDISESSGSNNIDITVTATSKNPTILPRLSKVTITVGNKKMPITITQAGSSPHLTINKSEIIADKTGAVGMLPTDAMVAVTSNMNWTVVIPEGEEWFTASNLSGSGDGSITFTFEENQTITAKSCIVKVTATDAAGVKIEREITVTQTAYDPPTLTLNPTTITAEKGAKTYYVAVTSNTTWSSSKPAGDTWYTISDDKPNNRVVITTTENVGVTKTSTITVTAATFETTRSETIALTQTGEPISITVSASSMTISADGATKNPTEITVTSNSNWTATSSDPTWLTVSPASGTSSASPAALTISATPRTITAGRSASITVKVDDDNVRTITVNQTGAALSFTVAKTDADFVDMDGGGESKTFTVTSNVDWTATKSPHSWVTVSPASGTASASPTTVTVTVNTNTDMINGRSGASVTVTPTGFGASAVTINISQAKGDIPADGKKLMTILAALNSTSTLTPTNWGTSHDLTIWEGVTITSGKVTGIELPSKGFDGTISAAIADFTELTKLDLSGNNLTGVPPKELAALAKMTIFKVSGNMMSGVLHSNFPNNPNYFTWSAMTNVYPQQGDPADANDYPSTLKLKLNPVGTLRVFYWATGGPSWDWSTYTTASSFTEPEWLHGFSDEPLAAANGTYIGVATGSGGSLQQLGGNAANCGNKLRNLTGSLPIELAMNGASLAQIRLSNSGIGGKLHKAILKDVNYINLESCKIEQDIAEILDNAKRPAGVTEFKMNGNKLTSTGGLPASLKTVHPAAMNNKNFIIHSNPGLTGTISQDIINHLKGKTANPYTDDDITNLITKGTGLTMP